MLNKSLFAVASVAIALTSSCASIVSKNTYPVTVNSYPTNASFKIKNAHGQVLHQGTTPSTITLKASAGYFKAAKYTIDLKARDGRKTTYSLTASLDGWYLGNAAFGGLIGMLVVDPATGNMWSMPESVHVTFASSQSANLQITTLDSIAQNDRKKLIPLT